MINIDHANKYYNRGSSNELHVINDLSIELPESGMVAIFGKSGCGKTTLLNAIGGLDKIDSGNIRVRGELITPNSDHIRNKYIGYIFQNYNLSKGETVYENVANALKLCGMTDKAEIYDRVMASLKNVGMEKFINRLPDTLSGGQQQRVAIARALVKAPAIILADEPTGNLDEANTVMVMDILKEVSKTRLVLLVTHEVNLVDFYCDKVIEIVDGAINSVRENTNVNGYFKRDKNDIYLGELPQSSFSGEGVRVEYYGEPAQELSLKIVNVGGRLYLKCDGPAVKVLDETSEIKLKEGVYKEISREESGASVDMSHLTPFEGKRYGRLFDLKTALKGGHAAFFSQKKKRGSRLLRVCLALLAMVTVFMSANFAVGIGSLINASDELSDNAFFIPLTMELDTSSIYGSIGKNGIQYARIVGSDVTSGAYESFTFRVGNFMSATNIGSITAKGSVYDYSICKGKRLVAGSSNFEKPLDTVITTAVADQLIEKSDVSFIKDYDDLINMISASTYVGSDYIRIIGVVESSEKGFYFSSLYATQAILKRQYSSQLNVTSSTLFGYNKDIPSGSVVVQNGGNVSDEDIGNKVTILGREYDVLGIEYTYGDIGAYDRYVYDKYEEDLLDYNSYIKQAGKEDVTETEYYFEYYFRYLSEYIELLIKNGVYLTEEEWAYLRIGSNAYKASMMASFVSYSIQPEDIYISLRYFAENGVYLPIGDTAGVPEREEYIDDYYTEYDEFWMGNLFSQYKSEMSNASNGNSDQLRFIMNDADYTTLAYSTGYSSKGVYGWSYDYGYDYYLADKEYDGNAWYQHYLMVLASDAQAAEQYLSDNFGADYVVTPEKALKLKLKDEISEIVANVISLAIVIVLICVCVFFIMRSSMMSRVKEIGVYRAIGVSKRNLIFRFLIETLFLVTLSLLIGFIIASLIVSKLASSSFTSSVFYYPAWFAALELLILYAVSAVSGILPIAMLTKRTPSEILAKYDI